jgi:acetyl-CoA carboxylase biotin carboxyl carrier protein
VSLTAADVAEIMRLVEESHFDEVTLEVDGMKISLRRGQAAVATGVVEGGAQIGAAAGSRAAGGAGADRAPTRPPDANRAPAQADPNARAVTSPLLGTFYRAPKPGAPPFVEVGSRVEEDTVVAIIEVMKLMNSVRAGVRGTVTEILPGDGTLVEYGETLLRVKAG